MARSSRAPLILFAIGMVGLGILALVYGDFVEEWQPVAAWFPGRTTLAYVPGVVMVLGGIGLLIKGSTELSIGVLFPFLIVGYLLQVSAALVAPLVEVNWEQVGELGILLGAGWVLFATRSGLGKGSRLAFAASEKGIRLGQILFALSLLPIGLSHFAYLENTVSLVPAWLPLRTGWAYLTGAGHIAAGLGVLFYIVPRLAATLEAAMLGVFTFLVWVPRIVSSPPTQNLWTEFLASWTMTAAAWVVANSIVKASSDGAP